MGKDNGGMDSITREVREMNDNKRLKILNMCNIYMLLWVLYSFHWYEVTSSPILDALSNVFLGVNLTLSLYYCVYCFAHYKLPRVYYVIIVLLLLFVVYGTVSVLIGEDIYIKATGERIRNGSFMIGPMRSFLPFFAFYVFCSRGLLTRNTLLFWGFISLIQFIFIFVNSDLQYKVGEFVNNNAYHFTVLLPMLFFIRRTKIMQVVLLLFLLVMVFLGMKRGAMLVAVFFVMYYLYINLENAAIGRKSLILIVAAIVMGFGFNYISEFYETSTILQRRLEMTLEGNSSSRNELYRQAWNIWSQADFLNLIFGFGASASLKMLNNYVHNDWLEILIDMGLMGAFVYLAFWLRLISTWFNSRKDTLIYAVLGGCIVVLLPRSIFGMMYSNLQTIAVMMMVYCVWEFQNKEFPVLKSNS